MCTFSGRGKCLKDVQSVQRLVPTPSAGLYDLAMAVHTSEYPFQISKISSIFKIRWFCYLKHPKEQRRSITNCPFAFCDPFPPYLHPPTSYSHPLLDHLFVSLPQPDKIYPIAMCILHSLSKLWLYDAWSMSQARGKGGLFLKFICNCESIQACAGMPALLKKKKKTVSNNVFLLKSGWGTSEPESGLCNGEGGACSGVLGGYHSPQPFLHLKFLLPKGSPASFPSEVESSSLNSLLGRSFILSQPKSLFAFVFPLAFK